jgi:hypothetical protein
VSIRRVDTLLFVMALAVMVVQWATDTGWLVIPFALLLGISILVPAKWQWTKL